MYIAQCNDDIEWFVPFKFMKIIYRPEHYNEEQLRLIKKLRSN
jgi:hypothetical protein